MQKASHYRKFLAMIFMACLLVYPLAHLFYWCFAPDLPTEFFKSLPVSSELVHWNSWTRIAGYLITLPSVVLLMRVFWVLRKLFQRFQKGIFFQSKNVVAIRAVAWALLLNAIYPLFSTPMLSYALTFQNPIREPIFRFSFTFSHNLLPIILSIAVWALSDILAEAVVLQDDADQTI